MAIVARTRVGSSFTLLGDERLARLAAAGHERAFAVVYQRYHQPLYRYCRSILRNDADAQDALQSTFAAAFAALGRGQRDAPIRPWLFRIAYNEAVSALRRRRPTAELSAASGAWTTSTEDRVAERAELRMLLCDLHKLSERQRSALVMRELSGLSHEEIAIALGTSVGTAKQTIYEARRSLFEFAEGREMPCDEIRRTISDADGRALRGRRVRAHLRECEACAEFAAAISERRAELRALAPALPTAAVAGLLEHVVGAGSGHGASAGLLGLATATAGKTAAAALTTNALAGMAVVAGATVGVGSFVHASDRGHASRTVAPAAAPAARIVHAPARRPALAGRSTSPARGVHRTVVSNGHRAGAVRSATATRVHRSGAPGRVSTSTSVGAGAGSTTGMRGAAPTTTGAAPTRTDAASATTGAATQSTTARAETPPGRAETPPGQAKTPPGQAKKATGQNKTPPGQAKKAGQTTTAPAETPATTDPGGTPPGQAKTPPGQAKKLTVP
jgi:RNA polymerase sigma factor (sigma-70 family)